MTETVLDFSPESDPPTLRRFARCHDFIRFIVGPVGSGKSTRCLREILRRAIRQQPWEGVRRTRWAIIRNTYGQLRDTTRKTFEEWVPAWLGKWHEQAFTFTVDLPLDDGTRVHAEILFRALDRPEDVKKLLSLELTGAYINEVREIPKHVVDVLETRVGRYPSKAQGGPSWFGIWADTNPWHAGHWGAKLFAKNLPGYRLFRQPGGRAPNAENLSNLPPGYYDRLVRGKDSEWVKVYVDGQDAAGDVGAIYGAWIDEIDKRGGICAFEHPTDHVFTVWDLGRSDSTAIWFWRFNAAGGVDIIDHYENVGQGLSHYFGIVDGKPYTYEHHWLPHDAKHKTVGQTMSVLEQCLEHWPNKVTIGPERDVDDGIAAARWLLEQPNLQFHERCAVAGRLEQSGIDALRAYRYAWDEDDQVFSRVPIHNWASHTADALRYLALVVKYAWPEPAKPRAPRAYAPPRRTLDDAWSAHDRERRR